MKINTNDYRLLYFERQNDKISELDALKELILMKHTITNWYVYLDNKNYDSDRNAFSKIFNFRCCYCGVSFMLSLNPLNLEVDHIYSKSAKDNSGLNINDLLNLAPSCHNCNSKKKAVVVTESDANIINPYSNITKVFYRTNDLYIGIHDAFKDNQFVLKFYKKLGLKNEIHRLNYICLVLDELRQKYKQNDSVYAKISRAFEKIDNAIKGALRY